MNKSTISYVQKEHSIEEEKKRLAREYIKDKWQELKNNAKTLEEKRQLISAETGKEILEEHGYSSAEEMIKANLSKASNAFNIFETPEAKKERENNLELAQMIKEYGEDHTFYISGVHNDGKYFPTLTPTDEFDIAQEVVVFCSEVKKEDKDLVDFIIENQDLSPKEEPFKELLTKRNTYSLEQPVYWYDAEKQEFKKDSFKSFCETNIEEAQKSRVRGVKTYEAVRFLNEETYLSSNPTKQQPLLDDLKETLKYRDSIKEVNLDEKGNVVSDDEIDKHYSSKWVVTAEEHLDKNICYVVETKPLINSNFEIYNFERSKEEAESLREHFLNYEYKHQSDKPVIYSNAKECVKETLAQFLENQDVKLSPESLKELKELETKASQFMKDCRKEKELEQSKTIIWEDWTLKLKENTEVSFSKRGGSITFDNGETSHSFSKDDFKKFISERYNGDDNPNNYLENWCEKSKNNNFAKAMSFFASILFSCRVYAQGSDEWVKPASDLVDSLNSGLIKIGAPVLGVAIIIYGLSMAFSDDIKWRRMFTLVVAGALVFSGPTILTALLTK